ncbi:MAG: hypothetical protein WKF71_06215 [Pyrinomonadaceae bacterium]
MTATLQATGGVTNPSAAQSYGALAPGSAVVNKNFTFTVAPNIACGSTITLTFNINDGATSYGTITKTFTTGVLQPTRTENFDSVYRTGFAGGLDKCSNCWHRYKLGNINRISEFAAKHGIRHQYHYS